MKNSSNILMIIGGIMFGLFALGFFNGGPAFIEAAFHGKGTMHIIGIIYLVVGIIGFIILAIGVISHLSDTPSSNSKSSTNSQPANKTNNDDYVNPVSQSSFYEYGTMRDEYGNETNTTHNTITDTYTDAVNNNYQKNDDDTFTIDDDE